MNQTESIIRRLGLNEQRKARNFLLRPILQLKLALYAIMLTLIFLCTTVFFGKMYFEQTYITLIENTTQAEYIQAVVTQQVHQFKSMFLMLLVVYCILMVVLIAVITHRLIGPTIPIMRQIRALKDGRYGQRVKLRQYDCFQEMADELNGLAETLEVQERKFD